MEHSSLIFTIALSLGLAFVLGFVTFKLRLSPIVGYLLAGICISPHTPGLVANSGLATQLSDIGIVLLMFGVGLHFSTEDLSSMWRAAALGAIPQMLLSTTCGALLGLAWGWPWGTSLIFGLALSVASTIVVINELEKRQLTNQPEGKLSVGWLLAQDLFVVLILVCLPAVKPVLLAPTVDYAAVAAVLPSFAIAALKAAFFIVVMLFAGRRFFPWFLLKVADTGSRELFTLFVIAVPLAIALAAATLFGVSLALGAFLAGMVLNESELSHHAAAKALPLQDAFAVLFFVAAGMSFYPSILLTHAWQIVAAVALILVFTPLVALLLLTTLVGYTPRLAAAVAAGLAQIGEFSLVLATLTLSFGVIPGHVYGIIVGAALVSIALHSFTYPAINSLGSHPFFAKLTASKQELVNASSAEPQYSNHAVLVGYGRVGSAIGEVLQKHSIPFVVIEENKEIVDQLKGNGIPCVYGSADIQEILRHAGIEHCKMIVLTSPDALTTRIICDHAQELNKSAPIVVRTHSESEMIYLGSQKQVALAVFGESELAKSIASYVTQNFERNDATDHSGSAANS